jgi:hypothetical protein
LKLELGAWSQGTLAVPCFGLLITAINGSQRSALSGQVICEAEKKADMRDQAEGRQVCGQF